MVLAAVRLYLLRFSVTTLGGEAAIVRHSGPRRCSLSLETVPYRTATSVKVGVSCVDVLSNTRKL